MDVHFTPFRASCSRYEMARASARSLALAAVCAAAGLACGVEAPSLPDLPPTGNGQPDAGTPDASVEPDAGSAPDCRPDPASCGASRFCAPDGSCQPFDRACNETAECASGDVCIVPLVSTSTIFAGGCGPRPDACVTDADCPGGVCWAIGLCGPRTTIARVVNEAAQPIADCVQASDCGPAGVCRNRRCAECLDNSDCANDLRCGGDGRCIEAPSCIQDTSCFAGNFCATGSRCARRNDNCTPDSANDNPASAETLRPSVLLGRSICGNDEDWYTIELGEGEGARFVIVTEPDAFTPIVTVQDSAGSDDENVSILSLPGRTAVELTGANLGGVESRTVVIGVSSLDQSGFYTLHTDVRRAACGADALDLYGDEAPILLPSNVAFRRRLCPDDEDRFSFGVAPGDEVLATTSVEAGPPLNLDLSGGAVAVQGTREVIAGPYATTASVTMTATLDQTPTAGMPYTVFIERELGTRSDLCDSPPVLVSGQTTPVNLASATDLGAPRCPAGPRAQAGFAPPSRNDALFVVDVPAAPALVTVRAEQTAGGSARISVAALEDCTDDQLIVACDFAPLPRREAELEFVVDEPFPVFFLVSSDGDREDVSVELTATVEALARPADDLCVNATSLAGADRVLASTYGAANDDQLLDNVACGSAGTGEGPDRFFALTVPAGGRAAVELSGPTGAFVWAGRRCDLMTATCTAAQARNDTNPIPRLTFEPRVEETYFIAVDGVAADDAGRSTLRVVENAECLEDLDCPPSNSCDDYVCRGAPPNDNCPGQVVNLDANGFARLTGSTGAATHGVRLSCIADAGLPDVAYQVLVPPGASELSARIVEATFDPAMAVRFGLCSSEAGEVCSEELETDAPDAFLPHIFIDEPAPGTYYVVIDSSTGRGAFTLDINVR